MKSVSATELRRRPSAVLARVEGGESLIVTRRGKATAVLLAPEAIARQSTTPNHPLASS
jgi:prevent-host-death family protein